MRNSSTGWAGTSSGANNLAYIVQVVETLELEELNATERKLYRPMWNKLLPHLEGSGRRSIATPCDRYRLVLQPDEPGALINVLRRVLNNADAIQDALSPEAWSALSGLRTAFARQKFLPDPNNEVCARATRRLAEMTTHAIPQFFGLAASSMMADDGWRFCLLGQQLERAIITANAPLACAKAFTGPADRPARLGHHTEIELSAFLRLLGTRDAYRRVYQMRAEPLPVLKLLFQNPESPRSVLHSLSNCCDLLRQTHSAGEARLCARGHEAPARRYRRLLRAPAPNRLERLFRASRAGDRGLSIREGNGPRVDAGRIRFGRSSSIIPPWDRWAARRHSRGVTRTARRSSRY